MNENDETNVCTICGKSLEKEPVYSYATRERICGECLDAEAEKFQICPNCGYKIQGEADSVGLLLTPVGASAEQKRRAIDTLVIVCPKCRILFFDEYHYGLIEGLKRLNQRGNTA